MGHKRLTYLDVPVARRQATASKALGRLKEALSNPALTGEQITAIQDKITHLNKWVGGQLGVNHAVQVGEEVVIVEEGQGEV